MIEYTEQQDGSLILNGDRQLHIPASEDNRDYKKALTLIADGDATFDEWPDSQRKIEYLSAKGASDWKASRAQAVSEITVTVDSMVFDGDEISQGRMARAVVASDSDAEITVWVLANNTPANVTASQLKQALKLAGLAQTALWVRA